MICLPNRGSAISLQEAAKSKLLLKPVDVSTLHRWRLKGLRGIKLHTWPVAGRRVTSEECLQEFLAKSAEAKSAPAIRHVVDQSANRKAKEELRAMGVVPKEQRTRQCPEAPDSNGP